MAYFIDAGFGCGHVARTTSEINHLRHRRFCGSQYRILTTTKIALPLASWISVWTNVFGGDGIFNYTISSLSNSAGFFRLVTP